MQTQRLPSIRPGFAYNLIVTLTEGQTLEGDMLRAQLRRSEYDEDALATFDVEQDPQEPFRYGLSLADTVTAEFTPGDVLMDLIIVRADSTQEPITDHRFIAQVNYSVTAPGA